MKRPQHHKNKNAAPVNSGKKRGKAADKTGKTMENSVRSSRSSKKSGSKHRGNKARKQASYTGDNLHAPITPPDDTAAHAYIYGRHAVASVLTNAARTIKEIFITPAAGQWLVDRDLREQLIAHQAREVTPAYIDDLLPEGSVHQGAALLADPLPRYEIEDIASLSGISVRNEDDSEAGNGPVIVLDQITDPQNIGAILRSAAAFGARALILQDRHSPAMTGALTKAAAGTAELIPVIRVVNIARSLDMLKQMGFFCVGLAGEGTIALDACDAGSHIVLVLGAEGSGLRPLVAKNCDQLVHIPMAAQVESLNVSAAAAIALYGLTRKK